MTLLRTDRSHGMPAALSCSAALLLAACVGAKGQESAPSLDILQVLPASGSLVVGDAASLGALRLRNRIATNVTGDVEWTSDDETILTVSYTLDAGAVVVAVGPGTGHITAIDGKRTATAEFVVTAAVASLELDKGLNELAKGTTTQLDAIMITTEGEKRALDEASSWGSSNPGVATVDQDGVVTGVEVGDAVITVTRDGVSASQVAHVRDWKLESIDAVAVSGTMLPFNQSTRIRVTGNFSGGHTQVITSLFDLAIEGADDASLSLPVTLEDATVTAGVEEAKATITGVGQAGTAAEEQTFSLELEVVDAPLTQLTLELPAVLSIGGDVGVATITGSYGDANLEFETQATLSADPPDPVSVDNSAASIRPVAPGTTTITATVILEDGDDDPTTGPTVEATQDIEVVEAGVDALTIEPASVSLAVGESTALTVAAAYGSASPVDVSDFVVWKSADESIALVSNVTSGQVTAVGPGTTTITASYRGKSSDVAIAVTP